MSSGDFSKLQGIESGAQVNTVTGIKGNSESSYRTGNVNITKANIGLDKVDNTADSAKTVASAGTCTGTAANANKLNTNAGSATQPVYFSSGIPKACTYTLGKSVPSDAKFTDTTYSVATTSANGLMSADDKVKLNSTAYKKLLSTTDTKYPPWNPSGSDGEYYMTLVSKANTIIQWLTDKVPTLTIKNYSGGNFSIVDPTFYYNGTCKFKTAGGGPSPTITFSQEAVICD